MANLVRCKLHNISGLNSITYLKWTLVFEWGVWLGIDL